VAGSSGNTDAQSKRRMRTKDLRGAGKVCGFSVMSSGYGGAVAVSVGTRAGNGMSCLAGQDDGGVRIRQRAGDGNNRAALGLTVCDPTMAYASSEPSRSKWRGLASVAGLSCACETCVQFKPRIKACSLAAAERLRRLLLTRATGSFVGVQRRPGEGQCLRFQCCFLIFLSLLRLLAVVACLYERVRPTSRAPTLGPRLG
jgi:hypothetical protein